MNRILLTSEDYLTLVSGGTIRRKLDETSESPADTESGDDVTVEIALADIGFAKMVDLLQIAIRRGTRNN